GAFAQGEAMVAGSGVDIEEILGGRNIEMGVGELGESTRPILVDIQVSQKCEFPFSFCHIYIFANCGDAFHSISSRVSGVSRERETRRAAFTAAGEILVDSL